MHYSFCQTFPKSDMEWGSFFYFYRMKRFVFLQILIGSVLFHTANAQVTNWDTYMAMFGGKPGSVLVDMELVHKAPDKKYTYLVITGPRAQNCDDQGIPVKEEIDILEDILSTTDNFITGVTAKVLAGTFTYNCERLNYYYVKDTIGIRTAIRRLYERGYKNYSYGINIKYEPQWKTYRTFLYPDEEMRNWMENSKIITRMLQQGDSLKTRREISFNFWFDSDTARKAFADFATANGYKVARLTESKKPPVAYAIVLSRMAVVNLDDMNKMTSELKREATKHNGGYSGWNPQTP
jgi:uncharacterized protein (TIGR01619 family)